MKRIWNKDFKRVKRIGDIFPKRKMHLIQEARNNQLSTTLINIKSLIDPLLWKRIKFIHFSNFFSFHYSHLKGDLNWKIPKISASCRNFLDPLPLFKKGPYRQKHRYFVPNGNYKVCFFQNFKPPSPISPESWTSPIFTIEVAP